MSCMRRSPDHHQTDRLRTGWMRHAHVITVILRVLNKQFTRRHALADFDWQRILWEQKTFPKYRPSQIISSWYCWSAHCELCYCSLRSQQLGQNPFQITFGDGILPRMSRDFAIFMAKHLAEYYLWTVTKLSVCNIEYQQLLAKYTASHGQSMQRHSWS